MGWTRAGDHKLMKGPAVNGGSFVFLTDSKTRLTPSTMVVSYEHGMESCCVASRMSSRASPHCDGPHSCLTQPLVPAKYNFDPQRHGGRN